MSHDAGDWSNHGQTPLAYALIAVSTLAHWFGEILTAIPAAFMSFVSLSAGLVGIALGISNIMNLWDIRKARKRENALAEALIVAEIKRESSEHAAIPKTKPPGKA